MEPSSSHDSKLLTSLRSFGVSIPDGVDAIGDLQPEGLASISARCLNLVLRDPALFPSSPPESAADKVRICGEMASAVENLGFVGDIGFHKVRDVRCVESSFVCSVKGGDD